MPSRRKRPCSICHRWFLPNNRVGSRQHTCGRQECRLKRRRKVQARWRALNPDYFTARRLQARMVPEEPPDSPAQSGRTASSVPPTSSRSSAPRTPPAPSAQPSPSPPTSPRSPNWSRPPEPLRFSAPLNRLPWDIAQSEFGAQGADFLGVMAGLLLRSTQFQIAAYRVDSKTDPATLLALAAQSPIQPAAYLPGSGVEAASHAIGIPPT
jgi:hypothetical protein